MLVLKEVGKDYPSGRGTVHALRGVSLALPSRGLVLVTGPAGSGKSTLLRLLSGMEPCSRGEMYLGGESMNRWGDRRWSSWRRNVGVAAAEQLRTDRTLGENLAEALAFRGVRGPRRKMAEALLRELALESRKSCRPGELSRGERKLAAMACALAGGPALLLAEEPLDGLEGDRAEQMAGLLRETGRDCLVMVFSRREDLFSPEEARVLHLESGRLREDGNGETAEETGDREGYLSGGLSLGGCLLRGAAGLFRPGGHLAGRLVAGICAAACAVLALGVWSGGTNAAVRLQQETLSAFPVTVDRQDLPSGDLQALGSWVESAAAALPEGAVSVQYSYDVQPWIFSVDGAGGAAQVNPASGGETLWRELPEEESLRQARYQLVFGRWPQRYDEVALVLDQTGTVGGGSLLALGAGEAEADYGAYLRMTFRLVLPVDRYVQNADGTWSCMDQDGEVMAALALGSPSVKIVGVLRPRVEEAADAAGGVAYTAAMTRYIQEGVDNSSLVTRQKETPETDVLTGLPFAGPEQRDADAAARKQAVEAWAGELSQEEWTRLYSSLFPDGAAAGLAPSGALPLLSQEETDTLYQSLVSTRYSLSTYEENMRAFGAADARTVISLNICADTFARRQEVLRWLESYGEAVTVSETGGSVWETGDKLVALFANGTGLLCLAALAAALAVICTTTAQAVGARRRERGILRQWGASRGQTARLYAWEGALAGLLAGVVGTLAAWCLCLVPGLPGAGLWEVPLYPAGFLTALCAVSGWISGAAAAGNGAWPGELLFPGGAE